MIFTNFLWTLSHKDYQLSSLDVLGGDTAWLVVCRSEHWVPQIFSHGNWIFLFTVS